jgi:hypothetical protein
MGEWREIDDAHSGYTGEWREIDDAHSGYTGEWREIDDAPRGMGYMGRWENDGKPAAD